MVDALKLIHPTDATIYARTLDDQASISKTADALKLIHPTGARHASGATQPATIPSIFYTEFIHVV